jgi:methyl-accepting chemotaxis protein
MDEDIAKRLQEIEDLIGSVALDAGDGIDVLDLRNELEDVERRLASMIEDTHEALSQLADRIESNAGAVQRLRDRLEEIAGTVDAIYSDMPSN